MQISYYITYVLSFGKFLFYRNPGKADKKRNKRKNKRYDSRGVYSQELNEHSRDYPGGSNYPDNRYQDMAPK